MEKNKLKQQYNRQIKRKKWKRRSTNKKEGKMEREKKENE